jgi:hypothetical protein
MVWHLFAACDLGRDRLYGHIKPRKTRMRFLEFARYMRSLYPCEVRTAIVCDNFSPHLETATPTTPAYVGSSPAPAWLDQRLPERPVLSPRSWF